MVNALGVELPAGALPLDQQLWRGGFDAIEGKYNDYMRSVYDRIASPWWGQEQLLWANTDWELQPSAATEWSVSDDGLTWTFKIRDGLEFSDGTPITAADFEWTMKYALSGADRVFDFGWFWNGTIKNSAAAIAGEGSADDLGITAVDANTLEVTTEAPLPYFPQMAAMWWVSPRHVIEEVGEFWSIDPATYVSSGPWMLESYVKGQEVSWVLNPAYKGSRLPYVTRSVIGFASSAETALAAYLNNEISQYSVGGYSATASPADLEMVANDPRLSAEAHPKPELVTYYMGFNTTDDQWPFKDNLTLRQAFAYALDMPTLVGAVIPHLAVPAYNMLPPGFVGSKPDNYKDYYAYDPDMAKQLMSDAGYPDGAGFPKLTIWVRDPSAAVSALVQAMQKQLQDTLNIELEIRAADYQTFTDNLKHEEPLYVVPYGADYMDQSNLLGIWKSVGRHPWANDAYDAMIDEASSYLGSPAERDAMFDEAEKILVADDVGAIFMFHPLTIWLYPGNLKGEYLEMNKSGLFTGIDGYLTNLYFAEE
jgi:peptide/nickel transport system substrate-binding protein/oligopeptide transport system substrate-binding protein